MLKFRTMDSDAEQRKTELEQFNEMTGPVFKVTNDPRVTPIGRFLRKYSSTATSVLPTASPEPLTVCTLCVLPFSSLKRAIMRRA